MATFCETHVKPLNNFDEVRRRMNCPHWQCALAGRCAFPAADCPKRGFRVQPSVSTQEQLTGDIEAVNAYQEKLLAA